LSHVVLTLVANYGPMFSVAGVVIMMACPGLPFIGTMVLAAALLVFASLAANMALAVKYRDRINQVAEPPAGGLKSFTDSFAKTIAIAGGLIFLLEMTLPFRPLMLAGLGVFALCLMAGMYIGRNTASDFAKRRVKKELKIGIIRRFGMYFKSIPFWGVVGVEIGAGLTLLFLAVGYIYGVTAVLGVLMTAGGIPLPRR
ncbi:MAG: hypothetical protein ABH885_02865, partial [Candidatus Omnitrophota bacterium]